jgi:hypothetical protein
VKTSLSKNLPKCILLVCLVLTGCGRAPSFNILGSYFPAWLLCIFAGIAGASIAVSILSRFGMQGLIRWNILVYPCFAISIAFTLWLILFS